MRSEVLEKMSQLITAAFAFVAALAWNNAVLAIFTEVFGTAEGIASLLTYAVVVTVVAVLATIWIGRAVQRSKEERNANVEQLRKAG